MTTPTTLPPAWATWGPPRWPHQIRGVEFWMDAYDRGVNRLCLACPTGGGKTLVVADVLKVVAGLGKRVALVSNRKVLVDQIIGDLTDLRISHGVRAAGHEADLDHLVQICSMQTEASRVLKRKQWDLHTREPGDLLIIDEAHLHTTGLSKDYQDRAVAAGAMVLQITATPIGMGRVCDELQILATNSELRACGAHLLIDHYAPDEPDTLRGPKAPPEGDDLSENQQRAVMGAVTSTGPNQRLVSLQGRIWDHFVRLNPDRLPFICFAPGVHESIWIAQQFGAKGVRCAHIDGDSIWVDGEQHRRTTELWDEVMRENEAGSLPGLSCRFVLREGFNAPWLKHGIMATVFGSVQSYLQAGGRLSRFWADYPSKTLQDHGGNFWRHGSLNIDRAYSLSDTASNIFHKRADRIREGKERPPIVCPTCGRALSRRNCPCGWERPDDVKVARPVLTTDGVLELKSAPYFAPVRRSTYTHGPAVGRWVVTWKRACSVKWYATFRQAEADYARNNRGFYPRRDWPLMPVSPDDLFERVLDVPVDRLRGDPDLLARMRVYRDNQLAKLEAMERGKDESTEEAARQAGPAEEAQAGLPAGV